MYKLLFSVLLLSGSLSCFALPCSRVPRVEGCKPYPVIPQNYIVIDLGETKLSPEQLDRFALPQTYAPRINNDSMIAFNTENGCFVRQEGVGELSPQMSRSAAQCFGINDKGELLLGFDPSANDRKWALWKTSQLRKVGEVSIFGEGILGSSIYLRALNNQGIAVGSLRPAGKLRPLYWSSQKGLHHLGFFFGWDLEGIAWDINTNGTVVGTVFPGACDPQSEIPFVWKEKGGLERMTNYLYQMEKQLQRPLKDTYIQFFNPVIDHEDVVYGQVVVEDDLYRYMWYPKSAEIRLFDRGELKLNAVNKNYVFAGTLDNKATLYQRYLEPIELATLVENLSGWELIEITDINDACAVVGVGKLNGVYHLFHAKPLPAKAAVKAEKSKEEMLPTYIFEEI